VRKYLKQNYGCIGDTFIQPRSVSLPYIVKNCDDNMEEAKEPQMTSSSKSWNGSVSVVAQACDFINEICKENTLFAVNVNDVLEFFE
jgi:hypothetical protein